MTGTEQQDPGAWYATFLHELRALGIPAQEADRTAQASRAEADAAGSTPSALYGPAVLYAREVAGALRAEPPDPPEHPALPEPPRAPAPDPRRTGAPPDHPARSAPAAGTTAHPAAEPVLRLRGVHARRGGHTVLRGIDLEVRRGQIVAVVGANGAGKSTLMQVCAGLLRPSRGSIERTERFGYAPQLGCLAPLLTVDEHLRLFGAVRGMSPGRATTTGHRLLSRLGWQARGTQGAGRLSGGTQQKVNLCLAQLDSPDLLLLDEPYQGFDALAYEELWGLIRAWRSTGAGILLVTHLLRDIDLVDRVVELPPPLEALR